MTNNTFVRFQLQPNGLNYYCNHVCLTYFCLYFIQILLCIEMKIATFEWWSKNQLNWTLERIRFRREIRILNDFLFWMCSFVPIFFSESHSLFGDTLRISPWIIRFDSKRWTLNSSWNRFFVSIGSMHFMMALHNFYQL